MEKRTKRQQERERNEPLNPSSGRREVWSLPNSGGNMEGEENLSQAYVGGVGKEEGAGGDGVLECQVGEGGKHTSTEEVCEPSRGSWLSALCVDLFV